MEGTQGDKSVCKTPTPEANSLVSLHDQLFMTGQAMDLIHVGSPTGSKRYLELVNLSNGKGELFKIGCAPDESVKFKTDDINMLSIKGKQYWVIPELPKE